VQLLLCKFLSFARGVMWMSVSSPTGHVRHHCACILLIHCRTLTRYHTLWKSCEKICTKTKVLDFHIQNYLFVAKHNKSVVHGVDGLKSGFLNQNVQVPVSNNVREMHILFDTLDGVSAIGVRALG
jgi:hypothetical protein